jgi:hypothetical protein
MLRGGKLGVDLIRNLGKSNVINDSVFVDDFWVSSDSIFVDDFCVMSDLVFTNDFLGQQ